MSDTKEKQVCFPDCPDCILVEILVRLPLKSIFKFKAVSKHWLSLISDPFFACRYETRIDNRSPSKPWALLCYFCFYDRIERDKSWDLDRTGEYRLAINDFPEFNSSGFSLSFLPTKLEDFPIEIMASHNGLLLCCQGSVDSVNFFVCNPLTTQYVILPQPPKAKLLVKNAGIISQDDGNYKIVRIPGQQKSVNMLSLEIFASETGMWVELNLLFSVVGDNLLLGTCKVIEHNGILHYVDHRCGKIIAYDPYRNEHQVHLIDMPRHNELHLGTLAVCGGRLCYLEYYIDHIDLIVICTLRLWVLETYETGEWYLKHRTEFTDMLADDARLERLLLKCIMVPEAVHPFDLNIVYCTCEDALVSFNFQTRKLVLIRSGLPGVKAHAFVFSPWPTMIAQPSW